MLYLFRDEQQDALEELVTEESSDGYVEEESVQHRARYVGQRLRQQEHGQTDEHVRQDPGYPRLSNMHHTGRIFEHSREGHENARQSNSLIFNMATMLRVKIFPPNREFSITRVDFVTVLYPALLFTIGSNIHMEHTKT